MPGISLVNWARRKRNAAFWRPLQNDGKFAKTATIAENGQRFKTRDADNDCRLYPRDGGGGEIAALSNFPRCNPDAYGMADGVGG